MVAASRWRILAAVVALLVLGGAAGITLDRMHQPGHGGPTIRVGGHTIRLSDLHDDPLAAVERVIEMSPEQRERVGAILTARQHDVDEVWHDTHTRLQATMDSVVSEIAAVLDPDQAAKFRELANEVHRRHLPR